MINKLLSIIIEGKGKREGEGLRNCCRWKSSGRRGPDGGGAWSQRRFPGAVVKVGRTTRFLGRAGGEGRADSTVPGRFDVEDEWGAGVEAHTEEGAQWRRTRRRSGRQQMCGGEMTGLGFMGSDTLKKKNSSDRHDDIINVHRYIWIINVHRYCGYARRYIFLKIEFRID
jgi:hypothetical protein